MRYRLFLMACVSAFLVAFPCNIIGCGPEADPYDYYTSFFDNSLGNAVGFKPFYYTGYTFLYEDKEPVSAAAVLSEEWAAYTSASARDAYMFVNKFDRKDVSNLYTSIEKNQPLKIPDSVRNNGMTAYFIKSSNLEALGYILYAKQVEPYVAVGEEDWQPVTRDSAKMYKLAKNGTQLYKAAKTDLFKLKYGYQVMRLFHYCNHFDEVISFYDEIKNNPTESILQSLCLALEAGALYHKKNTIEAAYLFSKAFAAAPVKRISNYISFNWSLDSGYQRDKYLSLCRNNTERANMLAMFALGSPNNDLQTLKDIYSLYPASPMLEILSIREINKLEEKYFSPTLEKEAGGKVIYFNWSYGKEDSIYNNSKKEVAELSNFLHKAAQNTQVKNPGLYEVGAAYTAYIDKDYKAAKNYLSAAKKMNLSVKVRDQWAITNLLVTINEKDKIDASFEEQLLPSVQWLEAKAGKDDTWKKFYRNLMSEIIAKKYHTQGDIHKEALAIGAADYIYSHEPSEWSAGVTFLRNNLSMKDVEQLYNLLEQPQKNKFEQYLVSHNSISKNLVIDFRGTAYLREYHFADAITWLKKSAEKTMLGKNPFIDLTYDREEVLPSEKKSATTKIAFAEEMLRLQKVSVTDKANAAKYFYKMATGFYNTTYYGHTWELVQYDRSGVDGYFIPTGATAFQKEYYGCFTAEKYFEKAMNASNDPNFKARCLFMMAKCSQKQVHHPQYSEYGDKYDLYDAAEKKYWPRFKNNKYFPELVKNYSNTPFYKQAYNTCSYLKDFIKKK